MIQSPMTSYKLHALDTLTFSLLILPVVSLLFAFSSPALVHSEPATAGVSSPADGWRAGVATLEITPDEPMWLSGYGGRDHPSEGTRHKIWIKALALEDASGEQSLMISSDLLGLPKRMSDSIRDQIEHELGLSRAQVLLNSSHSHTTPVLDQALVDIYPLDDAQQQRVASYSEELVDHFVQLATEAFQSLEPVRLLAGNGVTRFQVNRRNNDEQLLHQQTELRGPNDFAVPVLKVENQSGEVIAIAFGYACHPTVLSDYLWSGDFPGFAQIELEEAYPKATALFFQGAGADQNPLPRRSAALALQYGRELAAAVHRVLDEEMQELSPELSTAYSEVDLEMTTPPTREELIQVEQQTTGYEQRWAKRMREHLESGGSFIRSYPYPVQVWRVGDLAIVALGGELVVQYALSIKQMFGADTFVFGYSNDVMSYIPSLKILQEGGYEGETAQRVYGLPSTWTSDIETKIYHEVLQRAKEAGVELHEY